MQKIYSKNKDGYSIIISIMTIGFLLILTTSTFNLVLQELQDGRGRENYMKAFAGAEGALELALMEIKEKGYGYVGSDLESQNLEYFGNPRLNTTISYDIESDTSSYVGNLEPYATDIIPLFIINESAGIEGILDINFQDLDNVGLNWNIISNSSGVSGIGDFSEVNNVGLRTLSGQSFQFQNNASVSQVLAGHPENYLAIFNPTASSSDYSLSATTSFTKPKAPIYSTAKIGKYSQNLKTNIDNSEFLGILKYSIYSGN